VGSSRYDASKFAIVKVNLLLLGYYM